VPNALTHMLCWNQNSAEVALVPWPDYARASDRYDCTGLACNKDVQRATFEQRKTIVFIEAWHLVIGDGVDPAAVHRALWPLDEYRAGLAADVPTPASSSSPTSAGLPT
jgi:hypothetical protein